MARTTRTITEHTDDIDGGNADETIRFALEGASYEIDLNAANAARLRDAFAPFIGHARKAGRGGGGDGAKRPTGGGSSRRSAGGGGDNRVAAIRSWAREQGLAVNDRGRIPASIVQQYDAAH